MKQEIVANHENDEQGRPAGGLTVSTGLVIAWQNGPLGRVGTDGRIAPNGCFVETVIAAAIDRLEYYQNSGFTCEENAMAIRSLEQALAALESRTIRRERAGTEGTHEGR